jgi:RHS repeat-associated protein
LLKLVPFIAGTTYTTAYEYDSLERPIKMTYPNGTVVEYSYDKNNIASLSINGSPFVTAVNYSADLMTSMSFANGVTDTITYNKKSDPTSLSMAGESYTYTYDAVGNIKQIAAQDTQTYNYDAVDRLIGTTDTNALISDQAFAYDPVANRVSMTSDISSTYNYQASSNKLTSVDGNAHTYDNNGNLLSDGINTYTYDQRNRLTSLNATNYEYNDRNLRARKQNASENSIYVYNLSDQLISETNLNTNTTKEYVYLAGVPVAYLSNGITYAVHTDHLGTPRYLTDADKTVKWRWRSAAFGETKADEDPDADGSNLDYKLRFAGQYYDNESGLHYNHNRYYNPTTGRYVTSDPIGLGGGLNTYAYVDANPLSWIDPLGLNKKKKCKKECDKDDGFDPWEFVPLYSCITNPTWFNCLTEIPIAKPIKWLKMGYKAGKAGSKSGKGGRGGKGGKGKKDCDKKKPGAGGNSPSGKKPNGNSKNSENAQHGYEIEDTFTGNTAKTGVSGSPLNKNGSSKRANSQANKWNKEPGNAGRYVPHVKKQIPAGPGARQDILNWEQQNANRLGNQLDPNRHTLPKPK